MQSTYVVSPNYFATLIIETHCCQFIPVMYKNKTLCERAKLLARKVSRRFHRSLYQEVTEITPLFVRDNFGKSYNTGDNTTVELNEPYLKLDELEEESATSPWHMADDTSKIMYFVKWPITFTLWCTIPDARRFKSCYILTFFNCVLWIGCISYFVVNISTNVGRFRNLSRSQLVLTCYDDP